MAISIISIPNTTNVSLDPPPNNIYVNNSKICRGQNVDARRAAAVVVVDTLHYSFPRKMTQIRMRSHIVWLPFRFYFLNVGKGLYFALEIDAKNITIVGDGVDDR